MSDYRVTGFWGWKVLRQEANNLFLDGWLNGLDWFDLIQWFINHLSSSLNLGCFEFWTSRTFARPNIVVCTSIPVFAVDYAGLFGTVSAVPIFRNLLETFQSELRSEFATKSSPPISYHTCIVGNKSELRTRIV